jgi:hypothetical protein
MFVMLINTFVCVYDEGWQSQCRIKYNETMDSSEFVAFVITDIIDHSGPHLSIVMYLPRI